MELVLAGLLSGVVAILVALINAAVSRRAARATERHQGKSQEIEQDKTKLEAQRVKNDALSSANEAWENLYHPLTARLDALQLEVNKLREEVEALQAARNEDQAYIRQAIPLIVQYVPTHHHPVPPKWYSI